MEPQPLDRLYVFSDTRRGRVVVHLVAWLAFVVLISVQWMSEGWLGPVEWVQRVTALVLTFVIPVYVNLYWWSRMAARGRYGWSVVGYVVIVLAWSWIGHTFLANRWTGQPDSFQQWLANTSFILLLAAGARAIFRSVRRERELQQLRARTAESEVAGLRAQLNPHFLFNTLNNIYAAILDDGERGAALVLKLSRVMRYHYELSAQPSVPLTSEIALVRAVVELERLRLSGLTEVRTSLPPAAEAERYSIPPLLLVPLVENGFKHGTHSAKAGLVDITLAVAEGRLTFTIVNSVHEHLNAVSTGVGLANLRARLALLYDADEFVFSTERDGEQWRTRLEIPLAEIATAPAPRVLAKAKQHVRNPERPANAADRA